MTKQYLSWIDIGISAPQPEQHLIIQNFAKKNHGKITFSDSEDIVNRFNQNLYRPRLSSVGALFSTLHADPDFKKTVVVRKYYKNHKEKKT